MQSEDKGTTPDTDNFGKANRINFRDYPSTAVVVLGALTSGLAWMLYKWLDKKSSTQSSLPDDKQGAEGTKAVPPPDSKHP